MSKFLIKVKNPVSSQVRRNLEAAQSSLLQRLTVRERPGKMVFRFWQEGPGYDRNLFAVNAVRASLEYIHTNPVNRNLCVKARDWRWTSARFYESDGQEQDEMLPRIDPFPAEFWSGEGIDDGS